MHLQKKKGTVHENLEGSIERWFSPRGYGFIEIPGKGDVFVHVNDIEGLKSSDAISTFGTSHGSTINVWGHSLKGSKVRFDVVETVRGYKAKKVKIVEKGNQRSDMHEGQRSPREPAYPEAKTNWVLPQQLEPPAAYHPHTSSSRESIHRARRRMEEAMNADGVPTHHVANMMRALPTPSSNNYSAIRHFHKAHADPQAMRLNYLVMPQSPPSMLPNQLPQSPPNFLKQASPRAYSDMVKQSMGKIVQELAPDLRYFEDLVVDYIMEYAGTISLSLINFNDMMSKASRAVRYQNHMGRMQPPRRRGRQLAGFAHPERCDAAIVTAYGEAH